MSVIAWFAERQLSTLFSRLSLVFTGILLCLGIVTLNIGYRSQQRYFEEFTQELNRPVAMYMVNQTRLFVNGQPDKQALAQLASHVMMINPSLDVHLLDTQGSILAAAPYIKAVVDRFPASGTAAENSGCDPCGYL